MDPTHDARGRMRRRGAAECGIALLVALCVALPLIVAGGTILMVAAHRQEALGVQFERVGAESASASGADDAIAQLEANVNFSGTYTLALDGHLARVTVTSWKNDKIDNDGNGVVDDAGEANYIGIRSVGSVNVKYDAKGNVVARPVRSTTSTTNVIVKKIDLVLPIESALYIDDPFGGFSINGNAFLINGNDTNVDNTKGPKPALPGIGTTGDPNFVKGQISKKQYGNVIGTGSPPSISKVPPVGLSSEMASLAPLATMTWTGASSSYKGAIGDIKTMTPVIAHASGNLTLNGGTTGCGILIVDGDLTVNGTFSFAGIMMVGGAVTFNGGGGNKDLHGALLSLGSVKTDVTINGTVQLQYSSQAISNALTKLNGGISLISWVQQ